MSQKFVGIREEALPIRQTIMDILFRKGYRCLPLGPATVSVPQVDAVITFWGTQWDGKPTKWTPTSRRFCEDAIAKGIPLVILTRVTFAIDLDIAEAAIAVLQKPLGIEEILSAVKRALQGD